MVKIENPKAGDPGRAVRAGRQGRSYFLVFNANKKSITIDLKSDAGKRLALVKDLARKADVFVENFAPGAIERLGLGADVVSKINPGDHLCAGEGVRRGQPVREQPGLRHDRAGRRAAS